MNRSPLSKEESMVKRVAERFPTRAPYVQSAIGDDAAVLSLPHGMCTLLSTDAIVEGTHFNLAYFKPKDVGYKAVVVNVSDIIAMHAKPLVISIALCIPAKTPANMVDAFFEGVETACRIYGLSLVGGDTVAGACWMACGHIIGTSLPAEVVYRHTAQANEVLCVTGDLGSTCIAWRTMEKHAAAPSGTKNTLPHDLLVRLLAPKARQDIIQFLQRRQVKPHAMIDLSDGLSTALRQLCEASKVGAIVEGRQLPIRAATKKAAKALGWKDALFCALHGGEDYELLFSVSREKYEQIRHHKDIHAIGCTTEEKENVIFADAAGGKESLIAKGWQHF